MKITALVRRIVFQIINDKRTLALIIVAPIFLMTLIYLLLGKSDYQPKVTEYGLSEVLLNKLESQDMDINPADSLEEGKMQVKNKETDALIYLDGTELHILFESSDTVKSGKVITSIQSALKELAGNSTGITTEYLYGKSNESLFDSMGYIMLAIMSFFIVFILAGISFLRERTNQTMERLLLTPVKRWQVILGYTLGFGVFAVLQCILLLSYVVYVLKMNIEGSLISAGIIMILLALSAVCLGTFFSIFSNNEFQVMQFIPVIVIPQIFFSGLISLDTIPYKLGYLSKIMPVYYASDALKSICIRGETFTDISGDIFALLIFIAIFFILNARMLRKYRNI